MAALAPACTSSQVTPNLRHASRVRSLPATTPMEPVTVPGWATIRSAAIAT